MPVERAELICTPEDAKAYYRLKLVGTHKIACHGKSVKVGFLYDIIHFYSVAAPSPLSSGAHVLSQPKTGGHFEVRVFSLARARLMDEILRAISLFTVSLPGKTRDAQRRVLHGPRLLNGQYMRVILQKGRKGVWTCLSAFPVNERDWREAQRAETAKFPPE